jgi:hypothetical protein
LPGDPQVRSWPGVAEGAGPARTDVPPRPRRSRTVLIAGIVVLLAAGGAATARLLDRPDPVRPARSAPPPGEPSAMTASAAVVPQPSPGATAATPDGAQAFVRYWFDVLNFATATGDTAPLDTASSPACTTCVGASTAIRAVYAGGGVIRGGQCTVRGVTTDDFFNGQRPILNVVFDRSPRSTTAAPAGPTAGASFATAQVVLDRAGTGWRVLAVRPSSPFS